MGRPKGSPRTPGSGRKKGTPNKETSDLRVMIRDALEAEGGVKYLRQQMWKNPNSFMSLLGRVVPKELDVKSDSKIEVRWSGARELTKIDPGAS